MAFNCTIGINFLSNVVANALSILPEAYKPIAPIIAKPESMVACKITKRVLIFMLLNTSNPFCKFRMLKQQLCSLF